MRQLVNYDATIEDFFKSAIAWLENHPVLLCDGVDKAKEAYEYMKEVQSDPKKHTVNNAVYANCDKLSGFFEYGADRQGRVVINNDLYFAVIRVLNALGKYYQCNYSYAETELLASIKNFKIASNREKPLVSIFYKMHSPYYFAQKQK